MKRFIYAIFLLLLYSCQKESIRESIYDTIESSKSIDSCRISLVDYTDFEWDTVYISNVFSAHYRGSNKELQRVKNETLMRKVMYFTKGNRLVYLDIFEWEEEPRNDVFFDLDKKIDFIDDNLRIYTQRNAVFKVEKIEGSSFGVYNLIPVN